MNYPEYPPRRNQNVTCGPLDIIIKMYFFAPGRIYSLPMGGVSL